MEFNASGFEGSVSLSSVPLSHLDPQLFNPFFDFFISLSVCICLQDQRKRRRTEPFPQSPVRFGGSVKTTPPKATRLSFSHVRFRTNGERALLNDLWGVSRQFNNRIWFKFFNAVQVWMTINK